MKFINKIFLFLGLVIVSMQPVKAIDVETIKQPTYAASAAIYGAVCCGAAGIVQACRAASYCLPKSFIINNPSIKIAKSPITLLYAPGESATMFRKNFGEAVLCGVAAYGLYALSKYFNK
ncbi:hypothetical protein M1446_00320 [Candidatus Dependentiae bacterium]|nr:hypothetical protein [Candidatus Dependentiae bacterium]